MVVVLTYWLCVTLDPGLVGRLPEERNIRRAGEETEQRVTGDTYDIALLLHSTHVPTGTLPHPKTHAPAALHVVKVLVGQAGAAGQPRLRIKGRRRQ